ncbi:TVP38/TMEM64 family protein [Pseudodesulfovibrio tunisiensis]|uniref:TVP38/TMEM64 family protein n=1 Tax=Pseudodesulfovibrio tunisiensis TaxID=463192 RepID=UPI001FB3CDA8|nr:VTT domain-containing protein [Pseudodesulfovibrio tunisiensis]
MVRESVRRATWRKVFFGIAALIAVGVAVWCLEHYGKGAASDLVAFVRDQGMLGPVVYIAATALSCVLLLPQTPFMIVCGVLFGWLWGAVYCLVGLTLGGAGSFLLARYVLRERLELRFRDFPVYDRMMQLSGQHPAKVVAVSRLMSVVHYSLASSLLGLTPVRFSTYMVVTVLAMVPECFFLSSGGHVLWTGLAKGRVSWEIVLLFVGALVVVGGVAVWMHRFFRDEPV